MSDLSGYVYVLINPSMEGLIKVGRTHRDVEARAKELSSFTGVPTPFIVAYEAWFQNCVEAEAYIHNKLESQGYRLSNNREFFQAPLKEVVKIIAKAEQLLNDHNQKDEEKPFDKIHSHNLAKDEVAYHQNHIAELMDLADYYFYQVENFEEAFKLYLKAGQKGIKDAYYMIGIMYYYGFGCLEDKRDAFRYFQTGAEMGEGRCCAELARHYLKQLNEYGNPMIAEANNWFQKYLDSDALSKNDIFGMKFRYIFEYCVDIYLLNNSTYINQLRELLLMRKNRLNTYTEEILNNAKNCINNIPNKYKECLTPLYLKTEYFLKDILE